jgi:hypothetical protein
MPVLLARHSQVEEVGEGPTPTNRQEPYPRVRVRAATVNRLRAQCVIVVYAYVENIVRRPLSLGCRYHNQPFFAPEFSQPALNIRGLVRYDGGRNSGFHAQKCRTHLRNELFGGIHRRAEWSSFSDGLAIQTLWSSSRVTQFVIQRSRFRKCSFSPLLFWPASRRAGRLGFGLVPCETSLSPAGLHQFGGLRAERDRRARALAVRQDWLGRA